MLYEHFNMQAPKKKNTANQYLSKNQYSKSNMFMLQFIVLNNVCQHLKKMHDIKKKKEVKCKLFLLMAKDEFFQS